MSGAHIVGYVVLTMTFRKAGRRWTASCEELGTATFGRSLPEARTRIREAIELHLKTLEDVGERERFFREHNIRYSHTKPSKTTTISVSITQDAFVQPYVEPIRESARELVHA